MNESYCMKKCACLFTTFFTPPQYSEILVVLKEHRCQEKRILRHQPIIRHELRSIISAICSLYLQSSYRKVIVLKRDTCTVP